MYISDRFISSNSSQSILTRPCSGSFAKCHGQTGCLSLSGTEIVKDRPDTLSIHGSPVCPSQTSHRPSDAIWEHSQILVAQTSVWRVREFLQGMSFHLKGYLRRFDLILHVKNISGADFITMISSKTWSSDLATIMHSKKRNLYSQKP